MKASAMFDLLHMTGRWLMAACPSLVKVFVEEAQFVRQRDILPRSIACPYAIFRSCRLCTRFLAVLHRSARHFIVSWQRGERGRSFVNSRFCPQIWKLREFDACF